MKRVILLTAFFFQYSYSIAQNNWLWAINGHGNALLESIATDYQGNCFAAGMLKKDSIHFGTYSLIDTDFNYDFYLLKLDPNGNVLWAKQTISIASSKYADNDAAFGVSTDGSGNSYLMANFPDTMLIGSNILINSKGHDNNFLAKYDPNGNVIWCRESTCISDSAVIGGFKVATNCYKNTFVTGNFSDTVQFWPFIISTPSPSLIYTFLAKYDSNGNVKWAEQSSGNTLFGASSICVGTDKYGNSIITGYFEDTVVFGSYMLGANFLSLTYGNLFVAKYDSAGNVLWANQAVLSNVNSGVQGHAITTDTLGYIYVGGDFIGTITLGSFILSSPNFESIFLAKYSPDGNLIWAKQSIGLDNTEWGIGGISIDNAKHIYITISGEGSMHYKVEFGGDTLTFNDTASFDLPSIVYKLDSNGNALCNSINLGGGSGFDDISSDTSGKFVYFGATAATTIIFGSDTVNPFTSTNPKWETNAFPFVARWEECDKTLGVNNIVANDAEVKVYPNPNNGSFTFSLANINYKCTVEMYNVLGENIYNKGLNSDNTEISLSGQPTGVYFYRVLNEDGGVLGSGKVVIQK